MLLSGTKRHTCQSQQLESSEAIRRAGKGTLISLLTLHFHLIPYKTPQLSGSLEGLSRLRKNGPFLEDMVQPSTIVAGIKPKVAKYCPGMELLMLANHYMLGRLKPWGTQKEVTLKKL